MARKDDLGDRIVYFSARLFLAGFFVFYCIFFASPARAESVLIGTFSGSSLGTFGFPAWWQITVGNVAGNFTTDDGRYRLDYLETEFAENIRPTKFAIRADLDGTILAVSNDAERVGPEMYRYTFPDGIELLPHTRYVYQPEGNFHAGAYHRMDGISDNFVIAPAGSRDVFYFRIDRFFMWESINGVFVSGGGAIKFYGEILESGNRKTPVIIVPGIMGSRLNRASDGKEVWPNIDTMVFSLNGDEYLNQLKLDANGVGDVEDFIYTGEILDRELNQAVYGSLINHFLGNGYASGTDFFQVPYDWRLDLQNETDKLDAAVQSALQNSPSGKVNIVAHSMGGLLVKEYLNHVATSSDMVGKLILIGSPQLGAPKAFKALNFGDSMGFELGPINILNEQRVKEITQNMPGAYELLPSPKYVEAVNGYVWDFRTGSQEQKLTYSGTKDVMFEDPSDSRNATVFSKAEEFHNNLDNQSINAAQVYNIVGCSNASTIGNFFLYDDGEINITPIDGDGTVPRISAMNLSSGYLKNYFIRHDITGVNHMGLVKDHEVLSLVSDIISANIILDLPEGISDNESYCDVDLPGWGNETTIVSTHSPVALHAYDSVSNHTGPLPNGDIELAIPGSSYEKLGENSFVFLPSGGSYRFFMDGLDTGVFDVKIRNFRGVTLQDAVTYLAVPLASSSTNAEVNFSGSSSPMRLDADGDNIFEAEIEPTAVLSGASSTDVAPPSIEILSPTSTDYVSSDILSLLASVSDDNSGVAHQEWSLNGDIVSTTTLDLFFLPLGTSTVSLEAMDSAGNPAHASLDFRIVATPSSTISDIERAFSLGWIKRKSVKNDLENNLAVAIRLEKLIQKVIERSPDGTNREKHIESIEQKIDKTLLLLLQKELEKYYSKGDITKEGYDKIREDVGWLLNI